MNVATLATTTFTHQTAWTPAANASYNVEVWTANPNGVADQNPINDSLTRSVFVNLGNSVQKNAVLEQFTTAGCQFCPDGAWVAEQIENNYQNVYATSVHSCFGSDAMTNTDASGLCNVLGINSAPTAMVDRKLFPGESDVAFGRGSGYPNWAASGWSTRALAQSNAGSPVDVIVSGSYNPTSRAASVQVNASFVDYVAPGSDVRVSLMLIEDSVTGTGNGYNQINFYNTSAGHPFAGAGYPIVGYVHKRVLRNILPSTWGNSGTVPPNYALNTNYAYTVNFNMPAAYDARHISLIGVVSLFGGTNVGEYEILNAKRIRLNTITSLDESTVVDENSFSIYPNPTDLPFANVEFNLSEKSRVEARIVYITGKEVAYQDFGTMSQGNQRVQLDTDGLENGFYFVNFNVGEQRISKKISVLK